jgi:hypothetical protein
MFLIWLEEVGINTTWVTLPHAWEGYIVMKELLINDNLYIAAILFMIKTARP